MEGTQGQQQAVVIYSKSSREKRGNDFETGFLLHCAGQRPMHRKSGKSRSYQKVAKIRKTAGNTTQVTRGGKSSSQNDVSFRRFDSQGDGVLMRAL